MHAPDPSIRHTDTFSQVALRLAATQKANPGLVPVHSVRSGVLERLAL